MNSDGNDVDLQDIANVVAVDQQRLEDETGRAIDRVLQEEVGEHGEPAEDHQSQTSTDDKLADQIKLGELTPGEVLKKRRLDKEDVYDSEMSIDQSVNLPPPTLWTPDLPSTSAAVVDRSKEYAAGIGERVKRRTVKQSTRFDDRLDEGDVESDYRPGSSAGDDDEFDDITQDKPSTSQLPKRRPPRQSARGRDDGDERTFQKRLKHNRHLLAVREHARLEDRPTISSDAPTPGSNDGPIFDDDAVDDVLVNNKLRVSGTIWQRLYKYQRTGVRWMFELDEQSVGGLMGDEMGLGKTVQVIAFLNALLRTKSTVIGRGAIGLGPCLIVTPATVMHQWVAELHKWSPSQRVCVVHASGSWRGQDYSHLLRQLCHDKRPGNVVITSYSTFVHLKDMFTKQNWHYVILDEGHIIRNPEAQGTLAVKQLSTPHRLILTGSPMQNNLRELWSLIDFVFPSRLGGLIEFTAELGVPITQGGYANATDVQVRTAYKCACILRDTIAPYLLRRMKADVSQHIQLPNKNEQVLFCEITAHQRDLYRQYISSRQCDSILGGKMDAFVGLILLRKLCNHADLVTNGPNKHAQHDEDAEPSMVFGHESRSGKMTVVKALLKLWHKQGHKVLLFSQSRQMLNILQSLVERLQLNYMRMDGQTAIGKRQRLVQQFNTDKSVFVFLLTTRVGGLGINLTGADRVLIYEPDWNPSTDTQARERAWRIGQTRPVTIYRLLTSGTIEEKIYHRQIFKQFLANRVLDNPKQRRFFKTNDLHDLFTLSEAATEKRNGTETAALFAGAGVSVTRKAIKRRIDARSAADKTTEAHNYFDEQNLPTERASTKRDVPDNEDEEDVDFVAEGKVDEKRLAELRKLARSLSRRMGKSNDKSNQSASTSKSNQSASTSKEDRRLEGEFEIEGLVGHTVYAAEEEEEEGAVDTKEMQKKQDDDVLHALFKKSGGVTSALRHDSIMKSHQPDMSIAEREADRVANRASAMLRNAKRNAGCTAEESASVKKMRRIGGGGRSLVGDKSAANDEKAMFQGREVEQRKTPTSASSMFGAIAERKRRHGEEGVTVDQDPAAVTTTGNAKHDRLTQALCSFIKSKGRVVTTEEILAEFDDNDRHERNVRSLDRPVFRSLLRELCTFDREGRGRRGVWKLKDDY